MRLRTAWTRHDDDQAPWMVAAVDEVTEDEWGRTPDFYEDDVVKAGGWDAVRELVISIPDDAVHGLWAVPEVEGSVES